MSSNEHHLICYDADKAQNMLNIFNVKNGNLVTSFSLKFPGLKEIVKLVALPDKPSVVAAIDVDKGNLIDIAQKKFIKSIPCWDGTCSKVRVYLVNHVIQSNVFLRMAGTVSMLLPQEAWICWISGLARSAKLSSQRSQKVLDRRFVSFYFSQTPTPRYI